MNFNEILLYCNDMNYNCINVARVISCNGKLYKIKTKDGIEVAKLTGKFIHNTKTQKDYPAIGDFILYKKDINSNEHLITKILKRRNMISRKTPISGGRKLHKGMIDGGRTEEQVLACNVDNVMIIVSLDNNFNIARIERYLLMVSSSGLTPIIVLTKADLHTDYNKYLQDIRSISEAIPVHVISSTTGYNLKEINQYLKPFLTTVFIGSSGVGKSTLLNRLSLKTIQTTNDISTHSGKGKHTTTHKEIFALPNNSYIIDTPGIKELQLWVQESDLEYLFKDIIKIESKCYFKNCSHKKEKNCAIQESLDNGELNKDRYGRYLKLKKEIKRLEERVKERSKKRR